VMSSRSRSRPVAPDSFAELLGEFRGCFSAWTYPVFCALAAGLVAQTVYTSRDVVYGSRGAGLAARPRGDGLGAELRGSGVGAWVAEVGIHH
jgi:hypothetical protein